MEKVAKLPASRNIYVRDRTEAVDEVVKEALSILFLKGTPLLAMLHWCIIRSSIFLKPLVSLTLI
ncbi:uncharacterized protein G2W53_013403 [Senna tora]|uniref:Uncharacterized protein n=1 Tax=Senna tora TaxID=362788 RepID=A0A834U2D4_9FABA|nr:uncharacterized protein G2W53_013403 [Senna tora]